jgi:GPH family glycoside/pentoside/hexuronide:cation symporter
MARGLAEAPEREFSWREGLALCLAMIGVQLGSEVINTWGAYFYSPSASVGRTVYVSVGSVGFIFILGAVWDSVVGPLVGLWSDRTPSAPGPRRFPRIAGRRRPFIFWSACLLPVTLVLFWFPPVQDTSAVNFIFGVAVLCVHWTIFALGYVTTTALSQEIARSEKARITVGIWVGVGMLLGLVFAALVGEVFTLLDPARDSGGFSATGYRRTAVVIGGLCCVLFMLPVWLVRERYSQDAPSSESASLIAGIGSAFRNRPFVLFFTAFLLFASGFLATQRALPYWAELALGGDEGTVTLLFLPFLITALATCALIPLASRWLTPKQFTLGAFLILATGMPFLYVIGMSPLSADMKFALGCVLFGYSGIAQGIVFVMLVPMLGQVIDHDEAMTGQRREALYNGLNGVAWKVAAGAAVLIATQSMSWFGNSPEHPLGVYLAGPIAGVLAVCGFFVMLAYPEPGHGVNRPVTKG